MRGPIGEVGRNDAADETMGNLLCMAGAQGEAADYQSEQAPSRPAPASRPAQPWKKFELLAASCLGPPHFGHRDRLA
jgi:hypothetical protein